ncbi:26843_t:CDS:2 [Gigaspora margarita]|uniref:26843_t:CDS:1 n=1 Tax=Gigaspora margarita TaxID=4874 RepID=A0ABN7VI40_GIGMA|nr:26843_t:CDS:2 [Gigaspora margarita]
MADASLNELINKIITEEKEIKKYEYSLFSDFIAISYGSFGTVRKAKWENSTIVLKSITIDANKIDNGVTTETTRAINTTGIISNETTINRTIITKETPIRAFGN